MSGRVAPPKAREVDIHSQPLNTLRRVPKAIFLLAAASVTVLIFGRGEKKELGLEGFENENAAAYTYIFSLRALVPVGISILIQLWFEVVPRGARSKSACRRRTGAGCM